MSTRLKHMPLIERDDGGRVFVPDDDIAVPVDAVFSAIVFASTNELSCRCYLLASDV